MKKGINAWAFPADYTLKQVFELAKECGYDGIELNMVDPDGSGTLTLNTANTQDELNEILQLSKDNNLPITSVSSGLHWKYALTDNDPANREKGKDVVRKMIDAAAFFGSDTILVVPGVVTPQVTYKTAYGRALDAFNELKNYAETKNVIIGVENVWNKFLISPLEMSDFIDKIASTHVKAYFDAGNVLNFSYPESWAEALTGKIAKVHIKDFDTSVGNMSGFRNLLQGSMNWASLVDALRKAGYDDYLTAELGPYNTNPSGVIRDTAAALDYIVKL